MANIVHPLKSILMFKINFLKKFFIFFIANFFCGFVCKRDFHKTVSVLEY
jgi:hypothetical protein